MPGHTSPYWTAIDFDSDGEDESYQKSSRVYFDPWDCENIYNSHSMSHIPGENTNSFLREPVSASYYYVPTKNHDADEDNTLVEKKLYSARKSFMSAPDEYIRAMNRRISHGNEIYSKTETINYGYDYIPPPQALDGASKRMSVYSEDLYHARQPMVYESIPHPRTIQNPLAHPAKYGVMLPGLVPPQQMMRKRISLPIDYGMLTPRNGNTRKFSRYTDPYERHPTYESLVPDYHDHEYNNMIYASMIANKPPPDNFHLSRYGHLKIDYSFSWNSLDRLIRNK